MRTQLAGWATFAVSILAYVGFIAGAFMHPSESNMATWLIWVFLAFTLLYAQVKEGHAGWRMPLAYTIGNILLVAIALFLGGYTFNLGLAESIALFGFTGAVTLWVIVGVTTKKWDARLLYFGTILTDVASFYPIWKQYLMPHEPVSPFGLFGWVCFFVAGIMNVFLVERCAYKIVLSRARFLKEYGREKRMWSILEESLFSIEVVFSLGITIALMIAP